jgi:lipoic acid synthetase
MAATEGLLARLGLNTVCREALCPNYTECFSRHTATIMILGARCTRDCRFCNVEGGAPEAVDPGEPARVGEAAAALGLSYLVVTSVTRDDLPDGGAAQFAETIRQIRAQSPGTAVEVLVPDFRGDAGALLAVAAAGPDVISHNMETVEERYEAVRPGADYRRSLELIARIPAPIHRKSGVMVGIGETRAQLDRLFDDLRGAGCAFLTIGQYLSPSKAHLPVSEYLPPEDFDELARAAYAKGFEFVASAPFVRSSYHAGEALGRG